MSFRETFKDHKHLVYPTLVVYACYTLVAVRVIILGSSLLDLQIRIQASFSLTSKLVTAQSAGYLTGAILGGALERYFDLYAVAATAAVGAGICTLITPWLHSFLGMASCLFWAGIGNATIDILAHSILLSLWGANVGNFIQILHMCYAVGAQLATVLVTPFLLSAPGETPEQEKNYLSLYQPSDVLIMWPWLIASVSSLVFGFWLVFFYSAKKDSNEDEKLNQQEKDETVEEIKDLAPRKAFTATFYVALITLFVFSMQSTIGCFVQAFCVKSSLLIDKKSATLLNTLFWNSFLVSKIVFVVLSMLIGERFMVYVFLILTLIGTSLTYSLAATSPLFLWLAIAALGAGCSPLFSVAYSSLGKHFQIRGIHTSFIIISAILGESASSLLVGSFLDKYPNIFLQYVAASSLIFVTMSWLLPYFLTWLFDEHELANQREVDEAEIGMLGHQTMPANIVNVDRCAFPANPNRRAKMNG